MARIAKSLLTAAAAIIAAVADETINATPTAELLAWYNEHAERFGAKPVNKFASRKAAEERCAALAQAIIDASNAPPAPKLKATHEDIATAVSKTWEDPAVRAARSARHPVIVAGETYPSVRKAFESLGLELKGHVPFRAKLVKDGKAQFGDFEFKLAA